MSKQRASNGPGEPAVVTISNTDCTTGGGMADLSAVVTVTVTSSETIDSVEVLVDGVSNGTLTPRPGSPAPSGSLWIHTYDWTHGGVACGESYELQAIARVVKTSTVSSGIDTQNCPACP